jgi:hypothetical protein
LIYACPESIDIQLDGEDDIYNKLTVKLFLLLLLMVFYF